MSANELTSKVTEKNRAAEKYLYVVFTAFPWIHFFVVAYLFKGSYRPSFSFFEEVSVNYKVFFASNQAAMHCLESLGRTIVASNNFITVVNIALLVTLPVNFAVCYYSRKLIERVDV